MLGLMAAGTVIVPTDGMVSRMALKVKTGEKKTQKGTGSIDFNQRSI